MRSLKRQAKETEKNLLAENADNYNALVKERFTSNKSKAKPIALFTTIGAAVLALSLCLIFILPNMNSGFYTAANEVIFSTTSEEIESSVKGVKIAFLPDYNYSYYRIYDSKSNDTLYYMIYINGDLSFESVYIRFYVNKRYKQRHSVSRQAESKTVGAFTIAYDRTAEVDADVYKVSYKAEFKLRKADVFIDYEQMSLDDSDNFVNFFIQTFIKN